MLDRAYQPTTIDPNRLLIGVASVDIDGADLGAMTNASVEVTSVTKERYAGYPANRMETIVEAVSAVVSVTAEEIGSPTVLALLANLFRDLNSEIAQQYVVTMFAPFAGDGNLQLAANAKMMPELSIGWHDDWNSLSFRFECLGTNVQTLLNKSMINGPRKPATITDPKYLGIGIPQIQVGGASIGALQGIDLKLTGSTRKVETGYPKVVKDIIYENSKFELGIAAEETALPALPDVSVKLIQALVDDKYLAIEFPHCAILEDLTHSAQNDWTGRRYTVKPFKLDKDTDIVILTRG